MRKVRLLITADCAEDLISVMGQIYEVYDDTFHGEMRQDGQNAIMGASPWQGAADDGPDNNEWHCEMWLMRGLLPVRADNATV